MYSVFTKSYEHWYRIDRKFLHFFRSIKCAWQRATKGYCYRDIWGLDYWFMYIFPNMLQEFRNTTCGYPAQFKNIEDWYKILDEMTYYLYEMNDDNRCVDIQFNDYMQELENKNELKAKVKTREISALEYREICKNKFMDLFNRYFYNLWD